MLGLIETALFLVPLVLYAVWRITAAEGGPSPRWLVAAAAATLVLLASLAWFVREERMDPNATYVPPRLQDGQLLPGHTVPK